MDKIAVLIPCYNESITIKKVVEDFKNALPEATIYVYDNNSTDGTDEIARKAGAIVRYVSKQGKGNPLPRQHLARGTRYRSRKRNPRGSSKEQDTAQGLQQRCYRIYPEH